MRTYYLSGPMRTVPEHNYPAFMAVEKALEEALTNIEESPGPGWRAEGDRTWAIQNPARNFNGDKSREVNEYMAADLEMVLHSDVIVLLPGWGTSEGARREVELATWTGKRFMLAEDAGGGVYETTWTFRNIDVPVLDESPRASALGEATQLITGDRNNAYGPPTADFTRTADMATGFGFGVTVDGEHYDSLQGHHVAIFMMLLKTSRLAWSPAKRDSWVDDAGYAGCGYECAIEEAKEAERWNRTPFGEQPKEETPLQEWERGVMEANG